MVATADTNAVSFKDLSVQLPNGVPLINADDITVKLGERVLVSGPSGAGKSTLFRALAGVWPFGGGTVTVPKNARMMVLPQRPYFPIAPLAAAVAYPASRKSVPMVGRERSMGVFCVYAPQVWQCVPVIIAPRDGALSGDGQ